MTETTSPTPLFSLTDDELTIALIREDLSQFNERQKQAFINQVPIETLLQTRSDYMDEMLTRLWQFIGLPQCHHNEACPSLVAVGGYGRRELHPLSDIDILILYPDTLSSEQKGKIEQFLSMLWDLRLDVGQSVRSFAETLHEAGQELTIYTNLIESRLITGDATLHSKLYQTLFTDPYWPSAQFFSAKRDEQEERHRRYHGTSYNLEPDLKATPGGLRDIHIILWIALRHFQAKNFQEMVQHGFLTESEQYELTECLHFLWRIRFALHANITRYDNRLLFDRQLTVALFMGYDGEGNRPIELMMKDYYRVARRVSELNLMLIQLFDEAILPHKESHNVTLLDEHFCQRGKLIDLRHKHAFSEKPELIIQLFHHLTYNDTLAGIYSTTLRHLRAAHRTLTQHLCYNAKARALFLAILEHPNAVSRAILPMHKHGVLAAYLPQWQAIVGQMQFDLFHAYTVDEHTVRLLLNLEQFADSATEERHPLCYHIYPKIIDKRNILIAGLFHDIAKGRGGDHSQLGAQDSIEFCRLHQLSQKECELIAWLIENHLLMSVTAQRKDIQDPVIVRQFAKQVHSVHYLNHLLCLTVADICATNENLWNGWKQSLLRELYYATEQQLNMAHPTLPDLREQIRKKRALTLDILQLPETQRDKLNQFWHSCRANYFLRNSPEQLAWHAQALLQQAFQAPLVLIAPHKHRGGTEIFIFGADRPYLFAAIVGEIGRKNLNIYDAQIFTNRNGIAMDSFVVLEPNGQSVAKDRYNTIEQGLIKVLNQTEYTPPKALRFPVKLKSFHVPTEVKIHNAPNNRQTYLELTALDRPGLLAKVGEVFAGLGLSLHSARISTVGERVEDMFILTGENELGLSESKAEELQEKLIKALEPID